MSTDSEHAGRTALVTGAAGGLGRAETTGLARQGARVIMLDVSADDGAVAAVQAEVPGAELIYEVCDLADPRRAQQRVKDLAAAHGGIDILVNNAAVNPMAPIDGYNLDAYERTQTINATAAFALAQAVTPHMKAKRWGQIINITSITFNGGWKDFTAYVASKGALLGLTRSLARELGPDNIRVNAISPGAIPTPLETEVWGEQIESYEAFLLEHQSLKFRGSAEDVANAIGFLTSDNARFITGQNLTVDGGWWMH